MKTLLAILGIVAFVIVLGGAVNHETEVSFDYLIGSTATVSLFWLALAAAAALLAAGAAGWSVGRAGAGETRAKLEKELDRTYRRLRECEARLPRSGPAVPPQARSGADDAMTAVQPAPADSATVVGPAPDEAATAAQPAPEETTTAVRPAADAAGDDAPPASQPTP